MILPNCRAAKPGRALPGTGAYPLPQGYSHTGAHGHLPGAGSAGMCRVLSACRKHRQTSDSARQIIPVLQRKWGCFKGSDLITGLCCPRGLCTIPSGSQPAVGHCRMAGRKPGASKHCVRLRPCNRQAAREQRHRCPLPGWHRSRRTSQGWERARQGGHGGRLAGFPKQASPRGQREPCPVRAAGSPAAASCPCSVKQGKLGGKVAALWRT